MVAGLADKKRASGHRCGWNAFEIIKITLFRDCVPCAGCILPFRLLPRVLRVFDKLRAGVSHLYLCEGVIAVAAKAGVRMLHINDSVASGNGEAVSCAHEGREFRIPRSDGREVDALARAFALRAIIALLAGFASARLAGFWLILCSFHLSLD
jgi:hypothetical protein